MTNRSLFSLLLALSLLPVAGITAEQTLTNRAAAAGTTNMAVQGASNGTAGLRQLSTNLAGGTISTNNNGTNSVRYASGWGQKLKEGGATALVQIAVSIFGAGFIFERMFRLRRKISARRGWPTRPGSYGRRGSLRSWRILGRRIPARWAG